MPPNRHFDNLNNSSPPASTTTTTTTTANHTTVNNIMSSKNNNPNPIIGGNHHSYHGSTVSSSSSSHLPPKCPPLNNNNTHHNHSSTQKTHHTKSTPKNDSHSLHTIHAPAACVMSSTETILIARSGDALSSQCRDSLPLSAPYFFQYDECVDDVDEDDSHSSASSYDDQSYIEAKNGDDFSSSSSCSVHTDDSPYNDKHKKNRRRVVKYPYGYYDENDDADSISPPGSSCCLGTDGGIIGIALSTMLDDDENKIHKSNASQKVEQSSSTTGRLLGGENNTTTTKTTPTSPLRAENNTNKFKQSMRDKFSKSKTKKTNKSFTSPKSHKKSYVYSKTSPTLYSPQRKTIKRLSSKEGEENIELSLSSSPPLPSFDYEIEEGCYIEIKEKTPSSSFTTVRHSSSLSNYDINININTKQNNTSNIGNNDKNNSSSNSTSVKHDKNTKTNINGSSKRQSFSIPEIEVSLTNNQDDYNNNNVINENTNVHLPGPSILRTTVSSPTPTTNRKSLMSSQYDSFYEDEESPTRKYSLPLSASSITSTSKSDFFLHRRDEDQEQKDNNTRFSTSTSVRKRKKNYYSKIQFTGDTDFTSTTNHDKDDQNPIKSHSSEILLHGVPTFLNSLSSIAVSQVSAHPLGSHVLFICQQGMLFSYGSNNHGQLGLGLSESNVLNNNSQNNNEGNTTSCDEDIDNANNTNNNHDYYGKPQLVTSLLENGGKSILCSAGVTHSLVVIRTSGKRLGRYYHTADSNLSSNITCKKSNDENKERQQEQQDPNYHPLSSSFSRDFNDHDQPTLVEESPGSSPQLRKIKSAPTRENLSAGVGNQLGMNKNKNINSSSSSSSSSNNNTNVFSSNNHTNVRRSEGQIYHHQVYAFGQNDYMKLGLIHPPGVGQDVYTPQKVGLHATVLQFNDQHHQNHQNNNILEDTSCKDLQYENNESFSKCRCIGILEICASLDHSMAIVKRSNGVVEVYAWGNAQHGKLGITDLSHGQEFVAVPKPVEDLTYKPTLSTTSTISSPTNNNKKPPIRPHSNNTGTGNGYHNNTFNVYGNLAPYYSYHHTNGSSINTSPTNPRIQQGNHQPSPPGLSQTESRFLDPRYDPKTGDGVYHKYLRKVGQLSLSSSSSDGADDDNEGEQNNNNKERERENDYPMRIALGPECSMILTSKGHVYVFGRSLDGLLGSGINNTFSSSPKQIMFHYQANTTTTTTTTSAKISSLSIGVRHAIAVTNEGRVFTWGRVDNGRLGSSFDSDDRINNDIIWTPSLLSLDTFGYTNIDNMNDSNALNFTCNSIDQQPSLSISPTTTPTTPHSSSNNNYSTTISNKNTIQNQNLPYLVEKACAGLDSTVFIMKNGQVTSCGRKSGRLGQGEVYQDVFVPKPMFGGLKLWQMNDKDNDEIKENGEEKSFFD